MKIKIDEAENDFWFFIEAETIADATILLRLSNSAKREPIDFYTAFTKKEIYCQFPVIKKKNYIHNVISSKK